MKDDYVLNYFDGEGFERELKIDRRDLYNALGQILVNDVTTDVCVDWATRNQMAQNISKKLKWFDTEAEGDIDTLACSLEDELKQYFMI